MRKRKRSESLSKKAIIKNQAKSINQLSKVYTEANIEIEQLKSKVTAYMDSACMYKGENEDLRARCEEIEEMLRQAEGKLEIANKSLESEKAIKDNYFNTLLKSIEQNDLLKERLKTEINKSWWQKLKEGLSCK